LFFLRIFYIFLPFFFSTGLSFQRINYISEWIAIILMLKVYFGITKQFNLMKTFSTKQVSIIIKVNLNQLFFHQKHIKIILF
jgi:hypothetical protein